jgi:hypothetical protein
VREKTPTETISLQSQNRYRHYCPLSPCQPDVVFFNIPSAKDFLTISARDIVGAAYSLVKTL